jgi:beta-lactam-binding protein with PASTA domain
MDLDAISHQLTPARKLASLVRDIPSLTVEEGETTEVGVRLETASIPRMERHRRRRRLAKRLLGAVALVALLTAAAWGTWTYAIPHTAEIPALIGEPTDDAVDRLTALGFEVEIVDGGYSLTVPVDHVLHVRPAAGKVRDVGSTVTIVPSLGPQPVKVPRVAGDLLPDARQAIAGAGLKVGEVKRRFDGTVPVDHVIAVRPDTARLPEGTSVTLIVSDGPKPVAIPDVRGMTEDRALAALAAAHFQVNIEEDFSKEVARGNAMGTDPAAGTEVPPAETIVLTVSLGPEFFDCPDFFGMSVDAARALAESRGLEFTALQVPGSSGSNIVSQIPRAGTRIRYGTTVTVFYA